MVANIFTDVRAFVGDPEGDRWDDTRLLFLINKAQKDLALKARMLRGKFRFGALDDKYLYDLPDDLIAATRVTVDDKVMTLYSHEEMDKIDGSWESTTGPQLTHIIYDKLDKGKIRLYPIPDGTSTAYYYTEDQFGAASVLGTDNTGLIVNENTTEDLVLPDGSTVEINETDSVIAVYYIKAPADITEVDGNLEIDDIWATAITHYMCGHLLRGDKDTHSRQLGIDELKLYDQELKEAKEISARDFTKSTQYQTAYRRT